MSDKVAIVLLNWKGAEDTISCVESLLRLAQKYIGIYICDNASPDDSIKRIRQWGTTRLPELNGQLQRIGEPEVGFRDLSAHATREPVAPVDQSGERQITLIQTGGNIGFAAGNNVGLRYALGEGYEHFWLLNNDTEVEPDTLTALLDRVHADPGIGICGSTLVYFGQRNLVQNLGGGTFSRLKGYGRALGFGQAPSDPVDRDAIERDMRFVSGASMLVSREFLEVIGLMAEDYFLYYEELDWSFRSRGQYKLGYAPRSIVYHKVGASIGTDDFKERPAFSEYYLTRSRVKLCIRYSKRSLPFVFFDIGRHIVQRLSRGNWTRAGVLIRATIGLPL